MLFSVFRRSSMKPRVMIGVPSFGAQLYAEVAMALVNAATIRPVGIGIIRMKFDAQTRLQKRARNPGRRQAKQPARAGQFSLHLGGSLILDGLQLIDGIHVFEKSGPDAVKSLPC